MILKGVLMSQWNHAALVMQFVGNSCASCRYCNYFVWVIRLVRLRCDVLCWAWKSRHLW